MEPFFKSFYATLKMKKIQLEPWSNFQNICYLSAIAKVGEANWNLISRITSSIYDDTVSYTYEEKLSHDWCSARQCSLQFETVYSKFVNGPKKKKKADRIQELLELTDHVLSCYTQEFMSELEKSMRDTKSSYLKLKKEQKEVLEGIHDDRLHELLEQSYPKELVRTKLKTKIGEKNSEMDPALKSASSFQLVSSVPEVPPSPSTSASSETRVSTTTSPLLTSLLQSPIARTPPTAPPTLSLLFSQSSAPQVKKGPRALTTFLEPVTKKPESGPQKLTSLSVPKEEESSFDILLKQKERARDLHMSSEEIIHDVEREIIIEDNRDMQSEHCSEEKVVESIIESVSEVSDVGNVEMTERGEATELNEVEVEEISEISLEKAAKGTSVKSGLIEGHTVEIIYMDTSSEMIELETTQNESQEMQPTEETDMYEIETTEDKMNKKNVNIAPKEGPPIVIEVKGDLGGEQVAQEDSDSQVQIALEDSEFQEDLGNGKNNSAYIVEEIVVSDCHSSEVEIVEEISDSKNDFDIVPHSSSEESKNSSSPVDGKRPDSKQSDRGSVLTVSEENSAETDTNVTDNENDESEENESQTIDKDIVVIDESSAEAETNVTDNENDASEENESQTIDKDIVVIDDSQDSGDESSDIILKIDSFVAEPHRTHTVQEVAPSRNSVDVMSEEEVLTLDSSDNDESDFEFAEEEMNSNSQTLSEGIEKTNDQQRGSSEDNSAVISNSSESIIEDEDIRSETNAIKPEDMSIEPTGIATNPENNAAIMKSVNVVIEAMSATSKPDDNVAIKKPEVDAIEPENVVIKPEGVVVKPEGASNKPENVGITPDNVTINPEASAIKPENPSNESVDSQKNVLNGKSTFGKDSDLSYESEGSVDQDDRNNIKTREVNLEEEVSLETQKDPADDNCRISDEELEELLHDKIDAVSSNYKKVTDENNSREKVTTSNESIEEIQISSNGEIYGITENAVTTEYPKANDNKSVETDEISLAGSESMLLATPSDDGEDSQDCRRLYGGSSTDAISEEKDDSQTLKNNDQEDSEEKSSTIVTQEISEDEISPIVKGIEQEIVLTSEPCVEVESVVDSSEQEASQENTAIEKNTNGKDTVRLTDFEEELLKDSDNSESFNSDELPKNKNGCTTISSESENSLCVVTDVSQDVIIHSNEAIKEQSCKDPVESRDSLTSDSEAIKEPPVLNPDQEQKIGDSGKIPDVTEENPQEGTSGGKKSVLESMNRKEAIVLLEKCDYIETQRVSTEGNVLSKKEDGSEKDEKIEFHPHSSEEEDEGSSNGESDMENEIERARKEEVLSLTSDSELSPNNPKQLIIDEDTSNETDKSPRSVASLDQNDLAYMSVRRCIEEVRTKAAELLAGTTDEEKSPPRRKRKYSKSIMADIKPASPSVSSNSSDEDRDYRLWKKSILLVYNRLAAHKFASVFSKPIRESTAAGYHSVVRKPMDLSTIKRNIDNGTIRTTVDFQRDTLLMVSNAIIYNKFGTPVYKMACDMLADILGEMQVMVQALGDGVPLGGDSEEKQLTRGRNAKQAVEEVGKRKKTETPEDIQRQIKRRKTESLP